MKKRKNKKCTTKNTHIKRFNKSREIEPEKWYEKLATWVVIVCAIALIILIALNKHIVGYDNCIGSPMELSLIHILRHCMGRLSLGYNRARQTVMKQLI